MKKGRKKWLIAALLAAATVVVGPHPDVLLPLAELLLDVPPADGLPTS